MEEFGNSKKSFLATALKWYRHLSPLLELAAALILLFHFVPTPFEENLKETTLGLWIIFLIICVFLVTQNILQSKNLKLLLQKNEMLNDEISELLKQKEEAINLLKKTENYKRIFAITNKAFAKLREAHREDLKTSNPKGLISGLREFCDNLHETFITLNGLQLDNPCHVSIKIFIQSSNINYKTPSNVKVKLKTFMRDGRGKGERSNIDGKGIDHFVHENTDYLQIFESAGDATRQRYFMSNDLVNYEGYKNSSFKNHYSGSSVTFKYEQAPENIKEREWPLPYRSVITAPICPGISNPNFKNGTFIGFLCCDYEKKHMFSKEDAEIVLGFSEGLYDVLDYYLKQYLLKSHYV